MPEPEAPKLIIDTDWKSQAQAEKDRLAAAEKKKAPAPPAPGEASDHAGKPGEESHADPHRPPQFIDVIRSIATQALLYMGAYPDPETGRAVVAIDLAKFHIDLLGVLEEKTKGNLSPQEGQVLQRTAYQLRMEFVELSKELARAVQEGRLSPTGGPGPAAPGPVVGT